MIWLRRTKNALAVVLLLATACSAATPTVQGYGAGRSKLLLGVYEPDDPGSYGQVVGFAQAAGLWPEVVSYYSEWGDPFKVSFASQVQGHGGTTLIQLQPKHVSFQTIIDGQQDPYLREYAMQIANFGHKVILSFGQEMNGPWYSWGQDHVSPAEYIAAWRHIVRIFRSVNSSNVTWLWDVNCNFTGHFPIEPWWPGGSYVTWVGLDCYYAHSADTFTSIFGSTIGEIRSLTSKPIFIAETAVGPAAGTGKIEGLFAGTSDDDLVGFLWFDEAQDDGPYHEDWRLEGNTAALAAFKASARQWGAESLAPIFRASDASAWRVG
jgi:Glycosyl hydrolase family 26